MGNPPLTPENASRKDFFISYIAADERWAKWTAWTLEEEGYSTILQAWDFCPGNNFVLNMQEASVKAERIIAVLSPAYLQSRFTAPEWAAAFAQDPTDEKGLLLPVRVQECDFQGLLPQILYIDLVDRTEEEARAALLAGVDRRRAKPTTPPPLGPDKNSRDAAAEAERPPEASRESLDNPKKGVNWQFIGAVVGIIGVVVVVIFGLLDRRDSRQTAESVAEGVAKGVVEGLQKIAENTAGIASKDPDESAPTAARVQREPVASAVDRASADALRLQREGKFEEAIEKWRAIANIVGEEDGQLQILAWFSIGYLHSEGEGADLEASLGAYTRAIELNPTFAEAYNNRGGVKKALNRYDEAIADYDRAIELDPAMAKAYYNRGSVKKALNRHDEAIADYSRAIELNPTDAEAYYNRGSVREALGRHDEAIADYDRAIELDPVHAGVYYNRGNAKEALGRHDEAIADYSRAIELNPTDARAYNNRGNAKEALGRHDEAIADYSRAIELNPVHAGAYNNRGIVKDTLGRRDEAIADYSWAIELNPALAEAYYNRGGAKSEVGHINEAREDFQKALALAQEAGDENIVTRAKRRLGHLDNNETP